MAKKKKKKRILKKIARWHCLFSLALFGLYIGLSMIYSPEFLLSDIRQKFRALADETLTVTAQVLGPPVKPVVVGGAVCSNDSLAINLDWADDENSETFDIDRDSLPLIAGLTASQHTDENNLNINTSYTYIVTARGPMGPGFETSDPIIVTTPADCGIVQPNPIINITAFANKNIGSYTGTPQTENRKPTFSGTINIANADIALFINSPTIILAQTQANVNGYWSWQPPINLNYGSHTLLATATDPLDPSRTDSDSLNFRIVKDEDEEEKTKTKESIILPPAPIKQPEKPTPSEIPVAEIPLDFSLTLAEEAVLQGDELQSIIRITRLAEKFAGADAIIRYLILDERGEKKTTMLQDITLKKNGVIRQNIVLPSYLAKGKYHLQAEIMLERYNVSQKKSFAVLEKLLLNLGGGILISYPELLSNLGLIASILILLLLLWLILFSREYWLYLHALRHITEKHLKKIGLFGLGKRKGVSR